MMAQAPYFLIVFTRVTAFLAFIPFFNSKGFIRPVKATFAFILTMLMFPTVPIDKWHIPTDILGFIWLLTGEILVGILMGLALMILLFALELAGRIIGFQMAFSMANAMDATFGTNTNILSVLMLMVGTMIIITTGGDHYLIISLSKSFQVLHPGTFSSTQPLLDILSKLMSYAFDLGFRLAAPAIILLLAIDLTLGLIGKTAQKMQIFFVGLPLKIGVGLFCFTFILGFVDTVWAKDIHKYPAIMMNLFKAIRIS